MDWSQSDKMLEMSDEELTFKAADGDEHCFAALFIRFEKGIEIKASRFGHVGLGQEKLDFIQEGTIGLLGAIRTYKPGMGASFASYASRCIDNKMLSLYRRASGRKHIPLNSFVSLSGEEPDSILQTVPQSSIVDPEKALLERERLETIKRKIKENLSGMEHNVFTLYLRGKSYSEIAAALAVSVKTVDNALQRIRRKL